MLMNQLTDDPVLQQVRMALSLLAHFLPYEEACGFAISEVQD